MTSPNLANELNTLALSDLMTRDVLKAYEGWSVKRLAGFFVKHNITGAPVIAADDELVGVVTQTDVVRFDSRVKTPEELQRLSQFYRGPFGGDLSESDIRLMQERASEYCTVNSIMTANVRTLDIQTPLEEVCRVLVTDDIHRLFITRNGQLAGVVTATDILKKLMQH